MLTRRLTNWTTLWLTLLCAALLCPEFAAENPQFICRFTGRPMPLAQSMAKPQTTRLPCCPEASFDSLSAARETIGWTGCCDVRLGVNPSRPPARRSSDDAVVAAIAPSPVDTATPLVIFLTIARRPPLAYDLRPPPCFFASPRGPPTFS